MKIFKYVLQIVDDQDIQMPELAYILTAQNQNNALTLWVRVEEKNKHVKRRIKIIGTGNPIDVHTGEYISTVQMPDGLVWHLFDQG